jgi:hypothetical protein
MEPSFRIRNAIQSKMDNLCQTLKERQLKRYSAIEQNTESKKAQMIKKLRQASCEKPISLKLDE